MATEVNQHGPGDGTVGFAQEVVERAESHEAMAPGNGGALTEVPVAYHAYVDAQQKLGHAFKGRNRHDRLSYREATRRYQAYDDAITEALKAREKAEKQALDRYQKSVDAAIDLASAVYRTALKKALDDCRQATQQAWKDSAETSDQMRIIFRHEEDSPGDINQG